MMAHSRLVGKLCRWPAAFNNIASPPPLTLSLVYINLLWREQPTGNRSCPKVQLNRVWHWPNWQATSALSCNFGYSWRRWKVRTARWRDGIDRLHVFTTAWLIFPSFYWYSASTGNSIGVETCLANARRIFDGKNRSISNQTQLAEGDQANPGEVINLEDEEEGEGLLLDWVGHSKIGAAKIQETHTKRRTSVGTPWGIRKKKNGQWNSVGSFV